MTREHEAALARFERAQVRQGLSPHTLRRRLPVARRFLASLGRRRLASVTPEDVRRYLASREREVAGVTQAHELSHLRSFLRVLVAEGVLEGDPSERVRVRRPPPPPPVLLAEDAVRRVLAGALVERSGPRARATALALRDRAVVELLYGLGLRASEVTAARVVDLDLVQGTLLSRRSKRGRDAVLPLLPSSLPHLARYLAEARPVLAGTGGENEGRLLLTKGGRPLLPGYVTRLVARAGSVAGVRARPHALRRGVASHLVKRGAPLRVVQDLLGHEKLTTTQHYVVVDRDDLRRAVALLDLSEG